MKCWIAVLFISSILLCRSPAATSATCDAVALSSCLPALQSGVTPSATCCTNFKEQQSCICQFETTYPVVVSYINSANGKMVSNYCNVSIPNCSYEIWRMLMERYDGHMEFSHSDKEDILESTSKEEEAFRSCFVANDDEVASTSSSYYSSSDDDKLGFNIHVEFSSLIKKYTILNNKNKLMLEENNSLKCDLEILRKENDSCMRKLNSFENDSHGMKNDLYACRSENENLKLKTISLESINASNDMLRLENVKCEKKHDTLILNNIFASNDKAKINIIF